MSQLARTPKQIGDILRRERMRAGLSQTELADRAGVRQATVSQIETGQPAARLQTICDLMAALGLEMTIGERTRGINVEDIF
ncbi:MAG: helix-turn-helix transcriptional regulator [Proteobacteria bacterium]|nr:helix-turn-helix transcriptional regulator [Pseudomonadota bacterium]